MKLLIIGSTGMLGQALCREARFRGISYTGISRSSKEHAVDLTDASALLSAVYDSMPTVIINAAAETSIIACENDPGHAYQTNTRVVGILANVCRDLGAYLIQVSTDHYFTGDLNSRHDELASVHLLNEYARTKYAGEQFALTCPGALVVRTNIVGFRHKPAYPTFVEWVIEKLEGRERMPLFEDFYTSSIDVTAFSSAILDLQEIRPSGILNLASREVCNKLQFITSLALKLEIPMHDAYVESLRSLPGATRAESLGLDVTKAESLLGYALPSLDEVTQSIANEYRRRRHEL